MHTGESTAIITDFCTGRTRHKLFFAPFTSHGSVDDGQAPIACNAWMLSAKFLFHYAVAYIAQSDQVLQFVGDKIGIEKMERGFMVNSKIRCIFASLAGITITLKGFRSLCVPVCTSTVNVSTLPSWTILPFPFIRLTPKAKAPTTAKVMSNNRAWMTFKDFAASVACYLGFLASHSYAVDSLPKSIASSIAKMMLSQGLSVCLSLKWVSALVTG